MKKSNSLMLMLLLALTAGYILRVTWHDDIIILSWMACIGAALVALCYAIHRSPLGPLGRDAGHRVIDCGYWAGFALVLFCLFHGARPANASMVPPRASQPSASRPPPIPAVPRVPGLAPPVMLKDSHFVPVDGR